MNSILGGEWDSIADDWCLNRHRMDLYKGKKIILSCKNIFGLTRVICTRMFLSGGFAINDYSWTNRKISFYSDCTFSQIISVACKIPQLQKLKRSKAARPVESLGSAHTRTIVWLPESPFNDNKKVYSHNYHTALWKLICIPNSCIRYSRCFLMAVKLRSSPYDSNIGQLRFGAV